MSSNNTEDIPNGKVNNNANNNGETKPASATQRPDTATSVDLKSKLVDKVITQRQDSNASRDKVDNAQNGSSGSDEKIFYSPPPGDKFKCVACNEILRRPVKFEICGHSCCSTCFSDIMS